MFTIVNMYLCIYIYICKNMHTHLHACIYVCSEIKTTKIPPPPLAHGKVNTIFLQLEKQMSNAIQTEQ